jgi:hypothetical protein
VLRTASLAALLVAAAPAAAVDLHILVPPAFLGGPIAAPTALPAARAVAGPDGRPSREPDPCAGAAAGDCVVVDRDAETEPAPEPQPGPGLAPDEPLADEPDSPDADIAEPEEQSARRPAAPAMPPAPGELPATAGGLLEPAAGGWLRWQTPLLRWRPQRGAAVYNVQAFVGARRVLTAWTRAPRLRVPTKACTL